MATIQELGYASPDKLEQDAFNMEKNIQPASQAQGFDMNKLIGILKDTNAIDPKYTSGAVSVSSLPTNKKPPLVPANDTTASNALDIAALKAAESAMMKSEEDAKLAGQKAKEKTPAQTIADRVMDITGDIGQKSSDIEDLQAERDIAGKTEAVNKINSEIMITDRAYEKRIREIEKNKQGTFGGAVDQEVMRVKKQRNEDLADLSIQKAVALGDLETANNIIDTAIRAKYEPLENELKTLQTAYGMYQDDMSASQKQAASEAFTLKREETSRKNDLQSQALKMAQETGQYDVASGLLRLDPNSPTFDSDLESLTSRLRAPASGVDAPTVKTINGVDMQWNPTTGAWETITTAGTTNESVQKSLDQFNFLEDTIKGAKELADAAGPNMITQGLGNVFIGDTEVKRLQKKLDTLKVNLLTLTTDPAIKKFFGPQMTEKDTELMTSAGTTMDAYTNNPEDLKDELGRYEEMIGRMKTAVNNGIQQEVSGGSMSLEDQYNAYLGRQSTPENIKTETKQRDVMSGLAPELSQPVTFNLDKWLK